MKKFFLRVFLLFLLTFFSGYVFSQTCNHDGICDAGENKCTCFEDCGLCSNQPAGVCKQFSCVGELCQESFVFNCCGNRVCEVGETYSTCRVDCSPQRLKIEFLDFDESHEFIRGEEVIFKVKVFADEQLGTQAKVKARGFFGEITLFDDGSHGDKNSNDAVYANSFFIGKNVAKDDYTVVIEAEKDGTIQSDNLVLPVNPLLEIEANVDKESFVLGDEINVDGVVKRKGKGFFAPVVIEFVFRQKSIFHTLIEPDANGFFEYSWHTSLIDPAGEWAVEVSAVDVNQNKGFIEKKVFVQDAVGGGYFNLEFIEPIKKSFDRGEKIGVLIRVLGEEKKPVESARVEAFISKKNKITLSEVSPGNYKGKLGIPIDSSLGEQELVATAFNQQGNVLVTGYNSTILFVNMAEIAVETISPEKSIFQLGEKIDFKFKLSYKSTKPILGAKVFLKVNEKTIKIKELGDGFYSGTYFVPRKFEDGFVFYLVVEDEFLNVLQKELPLEVKPEVSPFFFISGNPFLLALIVVVILFLLIVAVIFGGNMVKLKFLHYKREQLIEAKKKLQNDYFNKAIVKSSDYYSLIEKYNNELGEIEIGINIIEKK